MKNLILVFSVFLLVSCCGDGETKKSVEIAEDSSLVTEMKVVYSDDRVEIRTYKLDGHDRILVRTFHGDVDDDHSENCKKCYEDSCN